MEGSTLQSWENSQKEPQETLLKLATRNNAIPDWNNVVGDDNVLDFFQISDIISRTLQNYLPQEGILPPLQNCLRKWVSQPSTTAPCNSTQPTAAGTTMKLGTNSRCVE